jgi:threonine aldolase
LSKGLGAPVGSLLIGNTEHILKAKRIRKAMGGGMRQAGFLAEAGLFALKNNVERLQIDHDRAKELSFVIKNLPFVEFVYPVETNIIIFKLNGQKTESFINYLQNNGIKAVSMGSDLVRFVLHLDINQNQFEILLDKLKQVK